MNEILDSRWLPYAAIAMISLGCGVALLSQVANRQSPLMRKWRAYVDRLNAETRFLQVSTSGSTIARRQLVGCSLCLFGGLLLGEFLLFLVALLGAVLPRFILAKRHRERVDAIEEQLDVWLVALSSALKAAPSLGEAIASSAKLTQPPLQEELDLVLKEMNLGAPLDDALRSMATRLQSRTMWGALATLLVARQTGGDVSAILDESAASLREMARLDGLVRAKTAEGKTQAMVLAGMPFVLLGAINLIDNTWLRPLTETAVGYLIIIVASALWLGGFVFARRILAVDI